MLHNTWYFLLQWSYVNQISFFIFYIKNVRRQLKPILVQYFRILLHFKFCFKLEIKQVKKSKKTDFWTHLSTNFMSLSQCSNPVSVIVHIFKTSHHVIIPCGATLHRMNWHFTFTMRWLCGFGRIVCTFV